MRILAAFVALSLMFLAVACGDDEEVAPSPTLRPAVGASVTPAVSTERGTPIPATGSTARVDFQAKPNPATGAAQLVDVRVGAHPEDGGYDRIVFEFKAGRPAGKVEYVTTAAQCGSGQPVDPQGGATLLVHFEATNAHNDQGQLTIPAVKVTGPGNSVLESISICDFEAVVQWAVGTNGMKPFVVSLLDNPSRVVVDVKH